MNTIISSSSLNKELLSSDFHLVNFEVRSPFYLGAEDIVSERYVNPEEITSVKDFIDSVYCSVLDDTNNPREFPLDRSRLRIIAFFITPSLTSFTYELPEEAFDDDEERQNLSNLKKCIRYKGKRGGGGRILIHEIDEKLNRENSKNKNNNGKEAIDLENERIFNLSNNCNVWKINKFYTVDSLFRNT